MREIKLGATAQIPRAPQITGMTPVRPLGSGGFSHVYLYEQDFPRRVTAVKILNGDFREAAARAAFEAEVNALGRLSSHPSIVSVWGAGVAGSGAPYLALEFCPGSMRARTRTTPASIHDVLDTGVRLAGALESAHLAGLLHRDVKPANVLLTGIGRPALSDFGIALRGADALSGGVSARLHAMSVPWSAPEVVTRRSSGSVASEIWSLAATLYSFAACRSPFEIEGPGRNTVEQLVRRISAGSYTELGKRRTLLSSVTSENPENVAGLDRVLASALQPLPQQRYQSMHEFGAALQTLQQQLGFQVTPMDVLPAGWAGSLQQTSASVHKLEVLPQQAHSRAEQRAQLADSTAEPQPPKFFARRVRLGAVITVAVVVTAAWAGVALAWL